MPPSDDDADTEPAIHPPGYEERRRQRIKEKYGIEIKTVSADPNDHESA